MTPKLKIIIGILALLSAFAAGRYTVFTKTVETKTTDQTETDTTKTKVDTEEHEDITVTETVTPDGTKTIVTTTTKDTSTHEAEIKVDESKKTEETKKEVTTSGSKVSLQMLAGATIALPLGLEPPVFGGSVSKEIFGPFTVGVWALSNRTIGVSIGINL